MKSFAIMIIWFGSGQYAQFDVERFDTFEECRAASSTIFERAGQSWGISRPRPSEITCHKISIDGGNPEVR